MPFLAQYTIRSKQSYIFRTNRLVEIVGGSEIISKTFDVLFDCMYAAHLKYERVMDQPVSFSISDTKQRFQEGTLDAAELFIGGGNDTILFRDEDAFRRANAAYTRKVLEKYPGLLPLCVGVEVEGVNYREDYQKLMDAAETSKSAMQSGRVENAQPFARQDRSTLQAISEEKPYKDDVRYRSAEADVKYRVGLISENTEAETKLLDELAKNGERSLLAIVHADGNNMGVKIQNKLGNKTDYDFCVNTMRAFNKEIDDVFTKKGPDALEARRQELIKEFPDDKEKNRLVRWIVKGGDDATFICNAKYALELTKAYLRGVAEAGKQAGEYSSCAGICIFHAHYPFARAYELAEQACDNAKKPVHKTRQEQAWLDFHYLRSGVNGDLEDIRELHRTEDCIARPWFVCGVQSSPGDAHRLDNLESLNELLHQSGVKRSQIKDFGSEFEVSRHAGELVWKRICYNAQNTPKLKEDAEKLFLSSQDALFRALYDLSDFFDLWFKRGGDEDD